MKLEETENLNLQYVNRIKTNATHINNIQGSHTNLIEKITEILNSMKRTQTLEANHFLRNGVIIADDTDTVLPNVDKNNKIIRIILKNTKNQINHSTNT